MKGDRTRAKQEAGQSAARVVADGSVVGLGTGSTAAEAISQLGERVDSGLDIRGIPTSHQSRRLAREADIPLTTLADAVPDIAIDGADQAAGCDLVKGGGAAHAREKIVDAAADRLLVVVDPTKLADRLDHPVPVEVLPDARVPVETAIEGLGGEPTVRSAVQKDGPVVTDNGNLVLDCAFGPLDSPGALATDLDGIPGVVAHGLFVGLADELHIGSPDGVERRQC
ncbi:MAG: ribose-5-phosphate isomerase [halophilic archaeon J07HX64]|jgi:ribose-5-phosphate isomerase (EC 5.3.1.6)|nr:MAG: ribose-5-phosphate isomerase [halophilic archaeon J07HX64]